MLRAVIIIALLVSPAVGDDQLFKPTGKYAVRTAPTLDEQVYGEDVTVWTMQGCMPCVMMKQVVGPGDGVTRVRYVEGTPPAPVPGAFPVATWTDSAGTLRWLTGYHTLAQLSSSIQNTEATIRQSAGLQSYASSSGVPEASSTPYAEIVRVLGLLPKPDIGFVDLGCGADARWCVLAAEKWGCKATGIEINHDRAESARQRVKAAGLEHLITIVEGDAIDVDVKADVAAVFLYQGALDRLRPKLERMKAFASYRHRPTGIPVTKNGDTWIYLRPAMMVQQPATSQRTAVWGGQQFASPVCDDPFCGMCASIRRQLGIR